MGEEGKAKGLVGWEEDDGVRAWTGTRTLLVTLGVTPTAAQRPCGSAQKGAAPDRWRRNQAAPTPHRSPGRDPLPPPRGPPTQSVRRGACRCLRVQPTLRVDTASSRQAAPPHPTLGGGAYPCERVHP